MDSLYIIKKQLEECKEKLADYETRLCINCMLNNGKCNIQGNIQFVSEQAGSVPPTFYNFGCNYFERKTNENNK